MNIKIKQGEYLRRAIRGRGLTLEEAAMQLDMKRSNLAYYLDKEVLTEQFKAKVTNTLGIEFNSTIKLSSLSDEKMIVITESELRQLITECVNDALKQFIIKAIS